MEKPVQCHTVEMAGKKQCQNSTSSLFVTLSVVVFQANGEACLGKYAGGVAGAAGGQSLFVAGHAY